METTRLSRKTLDILQEFDSPTISNTIEHFEVRDPVTGYANMELKCQFPEQKPMVGYAVTCTADTIPAGCKQPMRLDVTPTAPFFNAARSSSRSAESCHQFVAVSLLNHCK